MAILYKSVTLCVIFLLMCVTNIGGATTVTASSSHRATSSTGRSTPPSDLPSSVSSSSDLPSSVSSSKGTSPAHSTTAAYTGSSTTLTPEQQCDLHHGSCDACVKQAECMYCKTNNTCMLYPTGDVLPPSSMCSLSDARWGVCWLNFEALIISVSVIGGIIVITISVCCIYCCCCRGRSRRRNDREDAKYEQQKMERKQRQDDRRTERKGRLDEIRRKYGLMSD